MLRKYYIAIRHSIVYGEGGSATLCLCRVSSLRLSLEISSEAFKYAAETLYEAAHINEYGTRTDVRTHDIITYLFLIGLSLETLLKGLIVEADPTLIRDVPPPRCTADLPTYKLDGRLITHDLIKLADLAEKTTQRNLGFDGEERELLERLTFFVKWLGRYPAQIKTWRPQIRSLPKHFRQVLF